MKLAVRGLLIWALLLGGTRARGRGLDGYRVRAPTAVTLNNRSPTGYFPLDPETLASAPPILVLRITSVINPDKTAFQLSVYLVRPPTAGRTAPEKILIGNVGFYPADRPASFALRASAALRKLKATSSRSTGGRLQVEIRRLHETEPWTPVEVTVAPPEWRDEPAPS